MTTRQESIEKLRELMEDIEYAMLTTIDDDGSLRSRPMAVQEAEFDGDLWFFAYADSPKADEVRRDDRVNVSFSDNDGSRWVSVSGTGVVVRDRAKMDELWNPILNAWFPKGLDDPNLALLKVNVEQAEYWDSAKSAMVQLAGFVKAMVTGTAADPGENEKLDLTAD